MNYNTPGFALTFFLVSLLLSMAPFLFNKVRRVKKFFPNLIIFSAGMMLSVALNDLTPHLIQHHDHAHTTTHNHSHKHKHHDHHDEHTHAHTHEFNRGLFLSGLVFILLLTVDTIIMKHKHCEKDKLEEHPQGTHNHEGHKHPDTECCTDAIKYTTSKLQAFIFVLMISIHSFLEGMGKQSSKTLIALLVHKIIESISIGITIFTANFSISFALLLNLTYSVLTPLGLLFQTLTFMNQMEWFLNGCALGSIFFIIFIEMIPPHFHSKGSPLRKIVFLSTGYTISSLFVPILKIFDGKH